MTPMGEDTYLDGRRWHRSSMQLLNAVKTRTNMAVQQTQQQNKKNSGAGAEEEE